MNTTQLARRQERAASEALVIQKVEEGFRVYAADEPKNCYIVSGSPNAAQCTCPDFQYHHQKDPDWRCKHVLAVLKEFSDIEIVAQNTETYETEERRAIQEEGKKARKPRATTTDNGNAKQQSSTATLTLKRSVSPDGRIDSLSVEFSGSVDPDSPDDIVERARDILGVQTAIVTDFRKDHPSPNGNGNHNHAQNGQPASPVADSEGSAAVPARVLGVAGMDGKWGRRLFLTIEANGKILRFFGNAKELADHLAAIGFTGGAQHVAEGLSLNIPCRITTKPSPDGRYQNVDRLLPPPTRMPASATGWR